MHLADLRRLCIRRQLRVAFTDSAGNRCCINEHGATLRDGIAGWLQPEEEFQRVDRFEVTDLTGADRHELDRKALQSLSTELVEWAG